MLKTETMPLTELILLSASTSWTACGRKRYYLVGVAPPPTPPFPLDRATFIYQSDWQTRPSKKTVREREGEEEDREEETVIQTKSKLYFRADLLMYVCVCVCVSSSVCKRLSMLHQVGILVVLVVGNTEIEERYLEERERATRTAQATNESSKVWRLSQVVCPYWNAITVAHSGKRILNHICKHIHTLTHPHTPAHSLSSHVNWDLA